MKKVKEEVLYFGKPIRLTDKVSMYQPTLKEIIESGFSLEELIEPKGEFVIIVEGNTKKETYDDIDILSHVKKLIDEGYTEKEAIKKVAKLHNLEKNIVYMEYHGGK